MSYTKLLDKILWGLVTLFVFSFYAISGTSIGKYVQLGLTAALGLFIILRYGRNLNFHIAPFHVYMLIFLLFCFSSYFWTLAPQECLHWCFLIAQTLLCLSVVYIYADHLDSTLPLLDSIRWAGYLLAIYLFCVYGWGRLHYILQVSSRLGNDVLNSNTLGMLCAFSIILTLYRWIFFKFSISYLLIIPTFLLFIVSGSRKAFVILVLGMASILSMKYLKRDMLTNLINIFLIVLSGCVLTCIILSFPLFEPMKERLMGLLGFFSSNYEMDLSTYQRSIMMKLGFEQFLKTPIWGLGIGSSVVLTERLVGWPCYLHNNYAELLACSGIIGTVLYHLLYIVPGIKLFKQMYLPDKNTRICLILIFLLLLMEWGAVLYISKETYFFILIFFIQVKLNKKYVGNNL